MQTFGKLTQHLEIEYLTQHYIYIPQNDEKIDIDQLKNLLKNKRKTVAGTLFLYNPAMSPIGYNTQTKLAYQGYEFNNEYCELNFDDMCDLFSNAIKTEYKGKLLEIKYLFNLNRPNIEPTPVLEEFENDLDRYSSNQLTRYDKELNYHDYLNIRLSGKFVFFAWGHKYDRHHKNIIAYARNIIEQTQKLGKDVAFLYDNTHDEKDSLEVGYFLSPVTVGKFRAARANAFKKAFKTNPPTIQKMV
ncbi:hypothetical protein KKG72_05195 [bacterium]|nr:hypothetical protein [bacterium]MBU1995407.1 hypothetical protein [bacterium]